MAKRSASAATAPPSLVVGCGLGASLAGPAAKVWDGRFRLVRAAESRDAT
jgi:hypothetical protein